MTTYGSEYERLGGHLPEEIEALVKEYSRPRLMKPMPHVMKQIKQLNRDGGVGSPLCSCCYLVLTRAMLLGSVWAMKNNKRNYRDGESTRWDPMPVSTIMQLIG